MALRMTTMLLLLFLIAAVGSANGQQIVGVGKHTVNPDRTVKLAEGWNIATEKGSQPKGYQEYQCPIEIKENGDITVMYTKSGGGKTGCGLDLIAKKPANDVIRFTIAITTSDPSNTCLHNGSTAYNMLPFIHSVDNQEFQRMSKGGGWFGPDKGNCSKNDDPEQCKNNKGKYQCRKYTTYEFGWSFDEKKPQALVKPVGEPEFLIDDDKPYNHFYLTAAPFQPHTLIVTSKELQVEGANINDTEIRSQFVCTPQPDAKLYPVISWTIANGEETSLNGRHLLFFGLLAQDTKRDYFDNFEEDLPLCDLSLTFKGKDYELLHQEFIPTQAIPATNQTEQPTETDDVTKTIVTTTLIQTTTSPSSASADNNNKNNNMVLGILFGIIGAVALMAIGVLIYCMCFKNRKDDDESDESKTETNESDESKTETKTVVVSSVGTTSNIGSNGPPSQTEEEAATTYGRSARTAYGRDAATAYVPNAVTVAQLTNEEGETKEEKKNVDKDNNQKNQSLDGSKGVSVPSTYNNN